MPLIQGKSKKAFKENVKREMDAGKPQKQSLAIAYSVQRANRKKRMAEGGMMPDESGMQADMKEHYMDDEDMHHMSMAEKIRHHRKKKMMMAEGGEVVDIEENAHEEPLHDSSAWEEVPHDAEEEALDSIHYDEDETQDRPEIEADEHDMISRIRSKMRKRM